VDNANNTNRFTYDSRNNLVRTFDGRGNVTRYDYDGISRLTQTSRTILVSDMLK
jgi:YD repeat-containing protein